MKPALLALSLLLLFTTNRALAVEAPLVAVASSLRQVWPLLMKQYRESDLAISYTGTFAEPRVSFGSSGNLARQIVQGAPFELFLSADQSYPNWLIEKGASKHQPELYAQGQLAWVALPGTALGDWIIQDEKTKHRLPSKLMRLSIANPAFAPYGRAAKTVLELHALDSTVQLTMGENAVQALQFALSGASDGGIVPLALVSAAAREKLPDMRIDEIDVNQHQPLLHSMLLIGDPEPSTMALFNFILSESAQSLLAQHGFKAVP